MELNGKIADLEGKLVAIDRVKVTTIDKHLEELKKGDRSYDVLLDGLNIAGHRIEKNANGKTIRGRGYDPYLLLNASNFFEQYTNEDGTELNVLAVIRKHLYERDSSSEARVLLSLLQDEGKLIIVEDDVEDDIVVIQAAMKHGTPIISNDRYRDWAKGDPRYQDFLNRMVVRFDFRWSEAF